MNDNLEKRESKTNRYRREQERRANASRRASISRLDPESALNRLCAAGLVTREELQLKSGVTAAVLRRIAADDDDVLKVQLGKVVQVALALGVAPVELLPELLGRRPSRGILWERRVLQTRQLEDRTHHGHSRGPHAPLNPVDPTSE